MATADHRVDVDTAARIIYSLTASRDTYRAIALAALAMAAEFERKNKALREELLARTQGWEPQR